jgi:hypothetical protein
MKTGFERDVITGRTVRFFPNPQERMPTGNEGFCTATVCTVNYHKEELGYSSVNLHVLDSNGNPHVRHSVRMLHGEPGPNQELPYAAFQESTLKMMAAGRRMAEYANLNPPTEASETHTVRESSETIERKTPQEAHEEYAGKPAEPSTDEAPSTESTDPGTSPMPSEPSPEVAPAAPVETAHVEQ